MRRIIWMVVLLTVLSAPVLAGNISTPGVVDPPPPTFLQWVWGVITGD